MTLGNEKVKIKDVSDLLATRYAFLSGARTRNGYPILTFPDSRIQLSFPDYKKLINYLLQVPPLEDSYLGYVVILDRRLDKWSAVKTFLIHLSNYFPAPLRLVFLLKPEGVLQRALEVGYKTIADDCQFKIILCQNVQHLHAYLDRSLLTLDIGGKLRYNHLEWVQHRMDIERLKSSAAVIANSLEDFSRCLKDTELPNDAETTEHIMETQRAERDSIQEDFRIAVRRGMSLLKNVRQADFKPRAEQLSPTRLHNVTTIERMLIQLEETERSFDSFWTQHQGRLTQCLRLRRFEEQFRKLQSNFAGHMIYLEEHRQVGDSPEKVDKLIEEYQDYMKEAQANDWCSRGVELLSTLPYDISANPEESAQIVDELNCFLESGRNIEISNSLKRQSSASPTNSCGFSTETTKTDSEKLSENEFEQLELQNMILMTTTETSTLLNQVAARLEDVRKMCQSRCNSLQKSIVAVKEKQRKPVQAVSPEKQQPKLVSKPSIATTTATRMPSTEGAGKRSSVSNSRNGARNSPKECQKRAGHRLPLGAYLLKPVQRVTKYQLILKELSRHISAGSDEKLDVALALDSVLNLLQQLNASLQHTHVSGYPVSNLSVVENSRGNNQRFEIWQDAKADVFVFQPENPRTKLDWVAKLKQIEGGTIVKTRIDRPHSWASSSSAATATSSETSSRSSRDLSLNPELTEKVFPGDTNNNPSPLSLPEAAEDFLIAGETTADFNDNNDTENNTIVVDQNQILFGYTAGNTSGDCELLSAVSQNVDKNIIQGNTTASRNTEEWIEQGSFLTHKDSSSVTPRSAELGPAADLAENKGLISAGNNYLNQSLA